MPPDTFLGTEVTYENGYKVWNGMKRYEVRLVVRKDDENCSIDHAWTMVFWADNFGHAEDQALDTLRDNGDTDSKVERIELW